MICGLQPWYQCSPPDNTKCSTQNVFHQDRMDKFRQRTFPPNVPICSPPPYPLSISARNGRYFGNTGWCKGAITIVRWQILIVKMKPAACNGTTFHDQNKNCLELSIWWNFEILLLVRWYFSWTLRRHMVFWFSITTLFASSNRITLQKTCKAQQHDKLQYYLTFGILTLALGLYCRWLLRSSNFQRTLVILIWRCHFCLTSWHCYSLLLVAPIPAVTMGPP